MRLISGSMSLGTAMSIKNSLRLRRFFHGLFDLLFAQHIIGGPGGTDDDIDILNAVDDLFETNGLAGKAPGQFHASFEGSIGHGDRPGLVADQVLHGQFRHLAGTDQHDPFALQFSEDFPAQFDGRIADADGMVADAGFRAHFFWQQKRCDAGVC